MLDKILVCSINILIPINISTIPPKISALFFNSSPHFLPIITPIKHITKVIIPIILMVLIIETFKNAKLTPTANASILVAIARKVRVLLFKHFFLPSE